MHKADVLYYFHFPFVIITRKGSRQLVRTKGDRVTGRKPGLGKRKEEKSNRRGSTKESKVKMI